MKKVEFVLRVPSHSSASDKSEFFVRILSMIRRISVINRSNLTEAAKAHQPFRFVTRRKAFLPVTFLRNAIDILVLFYSSSVKLRFSISFTAIKFVTKNQTKKQQKIHNKSNKFIYNFVKISMYKNNKYNQIEYNKISIICVCKLFG